MKTLVAGWFSFRNGHATAGDILVRDAVCAWLDTAGFTYDVAHAPPFEGGVDLLTVDPFAYSHLVFVCGPFEQGELEAKLFGRFGHCRLIGLNLSMQVPLDEWSPFDLLIERDSTDRCHADIVFLSRAPHVPIVGVCRVEPHTGASDHIANAAVDRLIASKQMSVVEIDTRLDINSTGLRSPAEIESLIARMDAVVTTRLHGMVLAIKNGVPAIAIDPIAGGAKIRRQAQMIDWPVVFNVDEISDHALRDSLEYCLTEEAREASRRCATNAKRMVEDVRDRFIAALADPAALESRFEARRASPPADSWMSVHLRQDEGKSDAGRPTRFNRSLRKRLARLFRSK